MSDENKKGGLVGKGGKVEGRKGMDGVVGLWDGWVWWLRLIRGW